MKKTILLLATVIISILLVSCRTNQTNHELSIQNMSLTNENEYTTYVDGSLIDLTKYVSCGEDYEIIYQESVIASSLQTTFELNDYYEIIVVKKEDQSFRLNFYKNTGVSIKVNYPDESVFETEVLVGEQLNQNISNEINEIALKLGYEWNYNINYQCDDVLFEDVAISNLIALDDMIIYPDFIACSNLIQIDEQTFTIKTGDIINVDVENKEGYEFVGFTNGLENGKKYFKTLGNEFNTIYKANEYNITIKYLDVQHSLSQTFGEKFALEPLTIDGYDFNGWFYNNELFDCEVYNIPQDITLIASLTPKTYTLSFTNIDNPYNVSVQYNDSFTLPTPTKEGYIFLGWECLGKDFTEGKWTYLEDITLVAKWQEKQNDVSLNLETFGGEVDAFATIDTNGYLILPTPVKENYKFVGWFDDVTLEEEVKKIKASDYNNQLLYAKYTYDSTDLIGEMTITRINQHASNYDELAMFDSSESGFTSKYWHKVGISCVNGTYYVSAIAINGESLSTLGDYDFVVLAYQSYQNYTSFVQLGYSVGTMVYFTMDPTTLTGGNYPVQISFVKPNIDKDVESVRNELALLYDGVEEVSSDIDLIKTVNNYSISWHTSNRDAITNTGKYIKPYVTRQVTLEAYVGDTFVYKFTFKVVGEKETSDALATGYIYTPYNITQNAMDTLDIIYTAFLEIDSNGEWTNYSRMKSNLNTYILPKAKISGTKVVVSVNQNSSGNFSNVAKSAELREKLATNILNFIIEFDLDGIDIDWETPASNEATNFTLLMKDIYNKVKAYDSNLLVTAAIGGGMWAPPKYDLTNSKQYLDYINLMTYSMAQSNGYYQNSLYKSTSGATLVSCSIEESIKIYNDLGVKNSQILVGIPFYTTVQTNSGGPGSKLGDGKSVWYDVMLEKYPLSDTMKEYFDEECGVPYRYDPVNKIFISYDNERSIKIKCDYINTLGLAGIMYWQYGQDVDDMLSNAIDKYINS